MAAFSSTMSKTGTWPSATTFRASKLSRKRIRRFGRDITELVSRIGKSDLASRIYKSTFTGAASSEMSDPAIPSVNYVSPGHRFPLLPSAMTTPQCSHTSGNPYPISPTTPTSPGGFTVPSPDSHCSTFPTYQPRPKGFWPPGTKESIFSPPSISSPEPSPIQLFHTSTITYEVPSHRSNDSDNPETLTTTMLTVELRASEGPTRGYVETFDRDGQPSSQVYVLDPLTTTNGDISHLASQGAQRKTSCFSDSDGQNIDDPVQSAGDHEPSTDVSTPRCIRSEPSAASSTDEGTATCVDSEYDEELDAAIELSRTSWEDARTASRGQLVSVLQRLDAVSSTIKKEQSRWPLGSLSSPTSMDSVGRQQQDETRQQARDLLSDYIWRGYATRADASLLSDALDEVTR